MTQCLRCSKPCAPTSVFCDECRLLLRYQLQEGEHVFSVASIGTSPLTALSSEDEVGELRVSGDPLERITSPQPIVDAPPMIEDVVEQAVHQLNEAAQNIAKVEQADRRVPHASRLAPIRDISADIRRESTPLPRISKVPEGQQSEDVDSSDAQVAAEANVESEDLGQRLPDLWPWLQDESENDSWTNQTDPLMARRFPSSAESARIEEEDLRRAIAEGLVTEPVPSRRAQSPRMRLAFVALTILALLALVVDSVLISVAFTHPHHKIDVQSGPPTLALSPNEARVGQTVMLHINLFSSSTQVSLTHDIQEALQTTSGSSVVRVGPTGAADVSMVIGSSWEPGFHTIVAEDVTTRYTASATLQIIGAGSTRPSHLWVDKSALDMGAALQGANTIQFLTLHNSGGGSISWAASSDQPWLLLSPTQGTFSTSQTVAVGVERYNLKAGDYKGTITFSSNVGSAEHVQVEMTVRPLPANVGAVLVVTPVVLSYTAVDGGADPSAQLLMVSNPGSQPLYWSLTSNTPLISQDSFTPSPGSRIGWLTTDQTSGMVPPRSTSFIHAIVHSQDLLPGVYTDALVFAAGRGEFDSPETVSVSLTVQPHCGLTLSTGSISFIAVSGQSNPSNQGLGLGATSSCTGLINWHAISSASWLTVTPTSGQLKGATRTVTAVGVNLGGLKPGPYTGTISVLTGQSTQTVIVQLTVQAPPPPTAPILGASPLNLNFSTTQGLANPPGQVVTITNNGGSALHWSTNVIGLASMWLGASPTGGFIAPGQTGQVTVLVNTSGPPPLTPNTYVGQVVLNGTDANGATASGSPQTITVNLVVLPPCTLAQPSSSSLTFNAVQGGSNPTSQSVMITASGNCAWPLNWHASITNPPPWLSLTPLTGSFASSGQSASIGVAANIARLKSGTYSAQVSITATDSSGTAAQGSPQGFSVMLTVLQPCSLQVSTPTLSFTVSQGQLAPAQNFSLSETGTCARPVSWTVTGDAGSTTWLALSPPSSSDNGGGGTVAVTASATTLQPGTYTGSITVSAIDSNGATVQRSPQKITVSLTVTGFTVSGVVMACADSSCSTPTPLPGATVLLMSGSTQIASATADGSGNYSFSNVPAGTYTLSASGADSSGNHYSGTVTITVSGNQTGVTINAILGSA